jgi:hypothetical protein
MALGEADALARREEVVAFFGWRTARAAAAASAEAQAMH